MRRFDEIYENFVFMITEVTSQVEQTLQFFSEAGPELVHKIKARDDYIDNLKSLIEEKTFARILSGQEVNRQRVNQLRSVNTIASNLERIGDFAVNIVSQTQYLGDIGFIEDYNYQAPFDEVLAGLGAIQTALERRDVNLAFNICQCEFNLDKLFRACITRILSELPQSDRSGDLLTTLFIFRYLERMGDSLLNIGEAILFALMGERMKIHQYQALTESLSATGFDAEMASAVSAVEFESIWGTRSGCRIGTVQEKTTPSPSHPALFKQGSHKKLLEEKENIALWETLSPGLPPKVWAFQPGDDGHASILLEYLPGCTFQDVVINADLEATLNALFILWEILSQVWLETKRPGPCRAGFVGQIRSRQEAVYRFHSQFESKSGWIGEVKVPSMTELVDQMAAVESEIEAPFSVFIHGDLNVNNIIYDPTRQRIHFIDLHRSAQADYVQDVSVFLVSNFRLPVTDTRIRSRLNRVILDFYRMAALFADQQGDTTFAARLALGLGRSLFTSTRFELNRDFAKQMYLRAVYFLEKLADHRGRPWSEFQLPEKTLIY
jgi:phosphate uptake regulator